jgi:glutamine synthetase
VNAFRRIILRHMAPINTQWGYDNRHGWPARADLERRKPSGREPPRGCGRESVHRMAASLACGYLGMLEG